MKTTHDTCPHIERLFELIGKKWVLFILKSIKEGAHTFTDISKKIPSINTKILTDRLKELVEAGILEKDIHNKYTLTENGNLLIGKVVRIGNWWSKSHHS